MQALRTVAAMALAASIFLAPTAAHADGSWGDVDCDLNPSAPLCNLVVVDPGTGGGSGGSDGGGSLTCKLGGEIVPCYTDGFGWLGSDGCYFGKDGGGYLPEGWYIKTCYDPATDELTSDGTVFLADPPAALEMMIQRALSRLTIPRPTIASNPDLETPQLVFVPVWWWVQPGLWKVHIAAASLPGISITARAEPTKITWHAGDGHSKVCHGPGTQWTESAPALSESDCSHTYTITSRGAPGGKYTLRAVVTWRITWSGGGFSGTEPTATTADQATVEVTDNWPVITG